MDTEKYIAQASSFTNDDISIIINIVLIGFFTFTALATFLTIKQKQK